ncbi:hypothetical protein GW17_00050984 [Ensete ventricosum]|uniref:Uncharacterized protein n=1 Tax=Ensete ventricosum TaxID=4639 RepID=A0A444CMG1_ENSVE|nr:hypothetical protein GW17_00050984 [Ensete ventricosum]RZR74211.1 hypothetical protein BHM03_00033884 [Ensete ventricosum]
MHCPLQCPTALDSTEENPLKSKAHSAGASVVLRNKAPRWHEHLQCWCLNFHGRVTVASVKNFQLVATTDAGIGDGEMVLLQFGKVGDDMFTMDYRQPLSAFQAFAICLTSFELLSIYVLQAEPCLMARRSHLTEIGCIACDELAELGAGDREGWLDDPSLFAALHSHSLAVASAARPLVLVLGWDPDRRSPSSPRHPVKIHPSLSPSDGRITALEWLPFGDLLALALGTSAGLLLFYSVSGDLIHKQVLRNRPSSSLPLSHSLLRRWLQEAGSRMWENSRHKLESEDEISYGNIPFQLWNVGKFGNCSDAAITGMMPPPLLELQVN